MLYFEIISPETITTHVNATQNFHVGGEEMLVKSIYGCIKGLQHNDSKEIYDPPFGGRKLKAPREYFLSKWRRKGKWTLRRSIFPGSISQQGFPIHLHYMVPAFLVSHGNRVCHN